MGLPKAHRLRNRHDYRAVYAQGIRRHSPHLIAIALLSNSQGMNSTPASKFGISIGKKVSKKAVVRNRIKRQLKAAVRTYLNKINPGWQVVIVVKPKAIECNYEHFLRELEKLLKETKIINGY